MNDIDLNGSQSRCDKILTLENYWDGPQYGLCTFNGKYCVYEHIFPRSSTIMSTIIFLLQ